VYVCLILKVKQHWAWPQGCCCSTWDMQNPQWYLKSQLSSHNGPLTIPPVSYTLKQLLKVPCRIMINPTEVERSEHQAGAMGIVTRRSQEINSTTQKVLYITYYGSETELQNICITGAGLSCRWYCDQSSIFGQPGPTSVGISWHLGRSAIGTCKTSRQHSTSNCRRSASGQVGTWMEREQERIISVKQ
jgi:hypothetical protein